MYDLNRMEMYNRKILEIVLETGDAEGYCSANRNLGYVEWHRGNLGKAEEYARKALETAIENDFLFQIKESYKLLADISNARHDFKNQKSYLSHLSVKKSQYFFNMLVISCSFFKNRIKVVENLFLFHIEKINPAVLLHAFVLA